MAAQTNVPATGPVPFPPPVPMPPRTAPYPDQLLWAQLAAALQQLMERNGLAEDAIKRPLVIRAHVRQRSRLQRAVLAATRSALMRRDKRGRFLGLKQSFKAALRRSSLRRRRLRAIHARRLARSSATQARRLAA